MIEDRFAAAHQLLGYGGPCENIHGHTWKVQVFLKGADLGKTGMLFDFKEAKMILKDILKDFDHKNLNEIRFFEKENPTAENIARTIHEAYKNKLPKNIINSKDGMEITNIIDNNTTVSMKVTMPQDDTVVLNRAYFPGWNYRVNGNGVTPQIIAGLPSVPLVKGDNIITMVFSDTPVRIFANILSLTSVISIIYLLFRKSKLSV